MFCLRELGRDPLEALDEIERVPIAQLTRLGQKITVIERKTLQNFLADFGSIKTLHQQFAELANSPHAAVVIEAQYGDFLNEAKAGRWPVSHLMRVLAEIAALHPKLPLVFAGKRKLANIWAQQFSRR